MQARLVWEGGASTSLSVCLLIERFWGRPGRAARGLNRARSPQLVNSGEDVLVFYNDRASFQTLIQMMRSERDRMDENSPLMYHIHLVELLAVCTEGKNVYTEIKCNSLLPLDDIVRVVTHEDCIPEVSQPPGGALPESGHVVWGAGPRAPRRLGACSSFCCAVSVG